MKQGFKDLEAATAVAGKFVIDSVTSEVIRGTYFEPVDNDAYWNK
jgi:hypothetical protein